jgi:hypothetical protein
MSTLSDIRKQKRELEEQMKQAFLDAVQAFFTKYPDTYLVWAQYTPYFNDGDPCYFRVHTPELHFEGSDEDWGYGDSCESSRLDKEGQEMVEEIIEFIEEESDLMERLYGTDSLVKLNKQGAEVSNYEDD